MTTKTVKVSLQEDLDTRPIAMLVQMASQYNSTVYIDYESKHVNAKSIRNIHADTSSGSNEFHLEAVPETAKIDASSGSVKVYLPEDADITAEIDTASGDISYDLPFEKKGDTYKCGKGTNKVMIDTSSGDVTLNKLY